MGRYTCAGCGGGLEPDTDHVEIEVETVYMNDRNELDAYIFHHECALREMQDWERPQ